MKNKKVLLFEMIGIIVVILLGFLFHELYELSGKQFIIGLISPVNESKWEHWKIAFWPLIIYSFIEYFFIKDEVVNFWFSKAIAILVFQLITFGLIEAYELLFGEGGMVLHIATYVLGAIAAQVVSYLIMTRTESSNILSDIGIIIILVQILVFIIFTIKPIKITYFKDSTNGTFGIFEESR